MGIGGHSACKFCGLRGRFRERLWRLDSSSQNRTEHRDGVIPESARDWPLRDHVGRDLIRLGQVSILAEAHFRSESAITEQNVVLVVQVKASSVHVGRPNQGNLAIEGERLGVKQATFKLEYANPGRQQVSVVTAAGRLH